MRDALTVQAVWAQSGFTRKTVALSLALFRALAPLAHGEVLLRVLFYVWSEFLARLRTTGGTETGV